MLRGVLGTGGDMARHSMVVWGCAAVLGMGCDVRDGLGAADPSDELVAEAEPAAIGEGGVVAIPLPLPFDPLDAVVGDFDGDGLVDVLVAGVAGEVATGAVLRGNGNGTFQPHIDANLDGCSAFPAVGDLDGNARTDAVVLGCTSDVAAFVGEPSGALAPWSAWPPIDFGSGTVQGMVIVDYEGDGDGDVITYRTFDPNPLDGISNSVVEIDLTLGNGGTAVWSWTTTLLGQSATSGFEPAQMLEARLDDDGLVDLVLTDREHDVVRLMGVPPATFGFPLQLGVDVAPWLTRAGDLDGDGLDELVVVSRTDQALQVLLATGNGGLEAQLPVGLGPHAPYDATLADVDGDGALDVALVSDTRRRIRWLPGDGDGGFGAAQEINLPTEAVRIQGADFDGDGIDDLLAATFSNGSLSLALTGP